MSPDDIFHFLGSLDNIFTYIRTVAEKKLTEDMAIQVFIERLTHVYKEIFSDEERKRVLETFCRETFEKEEIGESLKPIDSWISMLKRLIVRVLNANVSLATPLQFYLDRTDLWSGRDSFDDLTKFEVEDDILLQHTYVILADLENKQKTVNSSLYHNQLNQ
ncbi:unnamed protein product [Rotaria magnacalcarata]|uniref:Uncharacterized protein n=1 Tax=Rotaria magnacalcarata TaxID=392030 RepID=A0A820GER7_9BILA|nr:unnamed protein product [Rotaria magnacalcarata]CAF4275763.1 unnamed protein product [Rotaria magnacalcarata]